MFKTWTYKGVAYQSEWKVRQEVFNQDRVCFGEAPEEGKVEFWAQFGVAYTDLKAEKYTLTHFPAFKG